MPELNWMGDAAARRAAQRVPYRLLQVEQTVGEGADGRPPENLLVQGDNLEALKSLLPLYAGRVKCIFIDPPYNTRSAFEHYDDNLEHSQWLSMMYPRLVLLRELLAEDGSIWVTIDDNEAHYLKVVMDEVFGRGNFVASCTWQQRTTRENRKVFSEDCENILLYCRSAELFKAQRNDLPLTEAVRARYRNPDNDPRGAWQSVSLNAQGGHGTPGQFYDFVAPNGRVHRLPSGRCWLYTWPVMQRKIEEGRVWFGAEGNNAPREKKFLSEAKAGLTPNTLWLAVDVGTNDEAKKEIVALFEDEVFDTPKPERLIQRILHIATNPNDLVLDSFLGSGTTAAVAHKMGRRWIGIEMGEHARTHCLPRLQKVVEGEQGGISQAVGWQGGGGFRFATLGEPVFDADGQINPAVRFAPLAAYVWREQTHTPHPTGVFDSPLLGVHGDTAFALLYNGILGDRRPEAGNVLTLPVWRELRALAPDHAGPWRIFGEACRLPPALMREHGIVFRQIPYQLGAG
jgi:adenine-specific DNA-methyltransferase